MRLEFIKTTGKRKNHSWKFENDFIFLNKPKVKTNILFVFIQKLKKNKSFNNFFCNLFNKNN